MNWVIIGSGNGLSPDRRQAITWTNADLLSIGLLGTYFSEIWIGILSFSFKKMQLKMLSAKMSAILSRGRWVNGLVPSWWQAITWTNVDLIPWHHVASLGHNELKLSYVIKKRLFLKLIIDMWPCGKCQGQCNLYLELMIIVSVYLQVRFEWSICDFSGKTETLFCKSLKKVTKCHMSQHCLICREYLLIVSQTSTTWVNIGSGNGLLPGGITWSNVDLSSMAVRRLAVL